MRTLAVAVAMALSGCSTQDYAIYAAGQAKVDASRYEADAARYKALASIAAAGDTTAKVAAVMAMQGNQGADQGTKLAAPPPNQALQWASVLVPGLTQIVGMRYSAAAATKQSDNARAMGESTNATFLGFAGKIQAPAANVTTLFGTGVLGNGTYNTDRHDATLSGTGTLGSGAYTDTKPITTTDNHTVTPAPVVTVTPVTPIVPTVITPVVTVTPVVTNPTVITPVIK